jgi:sortase (surface protein transpeptidase)
MVDKRVLHTVRRTGRNGPASLRRYGGPFLLLALGIAIGVLGATAFYLVYRPVASHTGSSGDVASAIPGPPARPGTAAKHIQPVTLKIPAIGVVTNLVDLGLNADKTLQAPTDFHTAGWFARGPAPGDAGGPPAIIAGHVDSVSGPAIFSRLHELTEGSDIQVTGIDGVVRHFKVYRTADYDKTAFPADEVYAATARAEVRLVTCTGDFDTKAGSYLSNLVVYAAFVEGG